MLRVYKIAFLLIAVAVGCIFVPLVTIADDSTAIRDEFNNLDNWQPLYFPRIAKHTEYSATSLEGYSVLKAESHASASGLTFVRQFDIRKYPRMKFRWRAENVISQAQPDTKSGDDYPIRIYVTFPYDPRHADFWDRAKYELARRVYGQYPPHSSLNYVWASKGNVGGIHTSPYADNLKIIFLEVGAENVGKWIEEDVDLLGDYKRAFGVDAPETHAGLAIMSDSDNTGGHVIAYLDYIELAGISR